MTSRLSSMLVQEGRVTAKKMADAFQRQVIFGGTLDTILLEMGLIEADLLGDYLSRASGLPYSSELPAPDAATAVHQGFSTALVERFRALPLGLGSGGKLRVMVLDAPDREDPVELTRQLTKELDRAVDLVVGPEYRFQQALEMLYGVRLLPRFAKIAGRIESGLGRGSTGSPASGPSLFAGRRPQSRPTLESTPAPAPRHPGGGGATPFSSSPPDPGDTAALKTTGKVTFSPPMTMARVSPDPVRRAPTPAPLAAESPLAPTPVASVTVARIPTPIAVEPVPGAVPGSRAPTPAPISSAPAPAVPRRGSPFERVDSPRGSGDAQDKAAAAAAVLERRQAALSSTLRGLAPPTAQAGEAAGGGTPASGTPHVSAFEVMNGPATLEDFVLPEAAAVAHAAQSEAGAPEPEPPVEPVVPALTLAEGLGLLHAATDRDGVLEVLCRIARGRFAFAAIYVVHGGEAATLSMALGAAFFDRSSLRATEVPLSAPSPLRTAVTTMSPYIGLLGDEDVLGETLAYLGRRVPIAGVLLPIVLRGRVVAVLHVDDGGRVISGDELAELVHASAETAAAFLRIIQAQKRGAPLSAAAAPSGPNAARPGRSPIANAAGVPLRVSTGLSGASGASGAGQSRLSDLPASLDANEIHRLLGVVEADDPVAAPAAVATLVGAPSATAAAVAERFPGQLRFAYRKPHAIGLSLVEHGPLLALAARLGQPMVAPVAARLSDPSPDIRFYAALVLGELRADDAVVPLGLRLYDTDPAVRRAAAYALSRHPPSPTLGRLLDQVREELASIDTDRQRAAAAASGELRDVAGVPKLIDLLTHRDMEVVDLARRALVVITKQDFGTARWRWRSWWEKARVQSRSEWLLAGLDQSSAEARRSAIDELSLIHTDRLGCHARLSRREREEAQRRFAEWVARHPEATVDEK